MFGHQNDVITQDQQADANVPLPDAAIDAMTNDVPADQSAHDNTNQVTSAPVVGDATQQVSTTSPTTGFTPPDPHPLLPDHTEDAAEPAGEPASLEHPDTSDHETPFLPGYQQDDSTDLSADLPADHAASAPSSDLLKIKQDALQSLSPLVHTLDLKAEDKFRTLMMMIQASDDQSLLPEAYETAQAIEDEKAKAQALLDVVNEINYFTQHKTDNQ
jgi:hypothetical protein